MRDKKVKMAARIIWSINSRQSAFLRRVGMSGGVKSYPNVVCLPEYALTVCCSCLGMSEDDQHVAHIIQ
jgi:hypothetical protein